MPNCAHGEMKYLSGEKNGKPWSGYFCTLPKGDPEQCKPQWGAASDSPAKKFEQSLDSMNHDEKSKIITRSAVAKSLIESGNFDVDNSKVRRMAMDWVKWCETGMFPINNEEPPMEEIQY